MMTSRLSAGERRDAKAWEGGRGGRCRQSKVWAKKNLNATAAANNREAKSRACERAVAGAAVRTRSLVSCLNSKWKVDFELEGRSW